MLVLSRKKNEEIIIELNGEKVSVRVVEIRGDKIRLGIDAPSHIPIMRQEIKLPQKPAF